MIYMIGSDLESAIGAGTADLAEMEQSGVDTEHVNLLVLTGGSEQWENGIASDKNTLSLLTENGFAEIQSEPASSMGDPKVLQESCLQD